MSILNLCLLLTTHGIEAVDRYVRPYGYAAVSCQCNTLGFQLIKE